MTASFRVGLLAVGTASLLVPGPACGQDYASWMTNWSPLRTAAVIERTSRTSSLDGPLILHQTLRVGSFWTAGNPAALADEVSTGHGEFGAAMHNTSGDYRRPLEPGGFSVASAHALGWRQVASASGLAGNVRYSEVRHSPGAPTISMTPHAISPFVISDSTRSDHTLSIVRVEGAGGRVFGRIRLGAALGYEAADGHSELTRVPRLNRLARPAAAVGLDWGVGGGGAIGLMLRHARTAETSRITNAGAPATVTILHGFAEPLRVTLGHNQSFYRRREAAMTAAGVSASGTIRGVSWAAAGEYGPLKETQWSQRSQHPPSDEWTAQLLTAALAAQGSLFPAGLVTTDLRISRASGDARAAGIDTVIYRSTELAIRANTDLRWKPERSTWGALTSMKIDYDRRDRGDLPEVSLRTSLEGLSLQLGVELSHDVTRDAALAAGYALTSYQGRGSAPAPAAFPPDVRAILAGENAYYATPAMGHSVTAGGLLSISQSTRFHLMAAYSSYAPRPGPSSYPLAPSGTRGGWFARAVLSMAPQE